MDMRNVKPPIGIAPHWYVNNERMRELCECIHRYLGYARAKNGEARKETYTAIAEWCEELKTLALLEARLRR